MSKERRIEMKKDWEKMTKLALIRAGVTVEFEISKFIISRYNIKRKAIKEQVRVTLLHSEDSVLLTIKKGTIPFESFNPKEKFSNRKGKLINKGITVNINKGKRIVIERGFAFISKKTGQKRFGLKKQEKMKLLFGPNLANIIGSDSFFTALHEKFSRRYGERLIHEMRRRGY